MESDEVTRAFGVYTALVFHFLVPRYVLIPAFARQRYVLIALATFGLYVANVAVSATYFPHAVMSALNTAMLGPFMSVVVALFFCEAERVLVNKPRDITG